MSDRTAQGDDDLLQHLAEQVGFLLRSGDAFDDGEEAEAKRIAATLRVLLHDSSSSHSLLGQFNLKRKPFMDSARPIDRRNMLSEVTLAIHEIKDMRHRWRPRFVMADGRPRPVGRPFEDWWNRPVIKDGDKREFSRRDLVLTLANQDGGAHVDPQLNDDYHALARGNSMNWVFTEPGGNRIPAGGPELACVRQIAHEVLATLQQHACAAVPEERRLPRNERRRLY